MKRDADSAAQVPLPICKPNLAVRKIWWPRQISKIITPKNNPIWRNQTTCNGSIVAVRNLACVSTAEKINILISISTTPFKLSARLGVLDIKSDVIGWMAMLNSPLGHY
jgi:hypothetical protein